MKDITKPLTSKILQHLKRVELHYLGNMRAGNRCSTDFPNKKLFRMLSPREKKQYEMWAKKGFWMQHAAVQECNQQSLSKNLVWITRTDSFIRALRRWPCSLIKVGELTTALKSLYEHAQKPERPVTPPKEPKAPHAPRARRYRPLSVGKLDQRFRSLLAMSLGVDLDEDGNVEGSIISEDWGGMFSQAELDQLSPKQRKLYQKLKKELSKNENMERLYRGENLAAISATAKKLLR